MEGGGVGEVEDENCLVCISGSFSSTGCVKRVESLDSPRICKTWSPESGDGMGFTNRSYPNNLGNVPSGKEGMKNMVLGFTSL